MSEGGTAAAAYREIEHRRIVVGDFGDADALRLVPAKLPAPPAGHARVKVLAAGVGLTDVMARTGDYILQRKTPFTPGYELVGEVVDYDDDGSGAVPDRVEPGMRVAAALVRMGAYSEYVTLPAWQLVPVPEGLDPPVAAAVPLDYLTATSLLETHGRINRGDAVLVHGAGGGVGQAAGRLGARIGLRMYGTASTADGKQRAAQLGFHVIDYREEDFEAAVREREPGGIQAVFDHIGGANLRKGYRLLARGGVLVSYAFAGRPGHMVADTVRGAAQVRLMGLLPGKRTALCTVPSQIKSDHDWYRRSLARLLTLVRDGELTAPVGGVLPLEDAAKAHRALERREVTGKLVLTTTSHEDVRPSAAAPPPQR